MTRVVDMAGQLKIWSPPFRRATLAALPGVGRVTVHFEHGDAEIEHDAALPRERLLETVEAAGYDAV